jgi:hypothetical protein
MPTNAKSLSGHTLQPTPVNGAFDLAFGNRHSESGGSTTIGYRQDGETGVGRSMWIRKYALKIPRCQQAGGARKSLAANLAGPDRAANAF